MLIVGERINTSRKHIADAVRCGDAAHILEEARLQATAGAHFLDVNTGTFAEKEIDHLKRIVEHLISEVHAPLCIDSTDPKVIAEALKICGKGTMVNSVIAENENYSAMLPLISEYDCKTVALCPDDSGIPSKLEDKLDVGYALIDNLLSDGIPVNDIYVDPLIMAVRADQRSGVIALEVISHIRQRYPSIHKICGLSNVSFGLPTRKLMNRVFLVAAVATGFDAVIPDPLDKGMMANLIAARTLLGNDDYCMEYIAAYRENKLEI